MASSVDVLPEYEGLVKRLQTLAAKIAAVGTDGGAAPWLMPDRREGSAEPLWGGDLFDLEGIAKLFSRAGSNDHFVDIVTGKKSGSQGDGEVLQLMNDYMAMLQRAFMSRHTLGKCQAYSHAMSRQRGHGLDYGVLCLSALANVSRIVASGKG